VNRRLVHSSRASSDPEWSELARIELAAIESNRPKAGAPPATLTGLTLAWGARQARGDVFRFVFHFALKSYMRDRIDGLAPAVAQWAREGGLGPMPWLQGNEFEAVVCSASIAALEAAHKAYLRFGLVPRGRLGGRRQFKRELQLRRLRFELQSGRHSTMQDAYKAAGLSLATGKRVRLLLDALEPPGALDK